METASAFTKPLLEVLTIMGPYVPLLVPPATALLVQPLFPRAGPLRAIVLGLRSRFFKPPGIAKFPSSHRTKDVGLLRTLLVKPAEAKSYIVVSGPKGVGKSCAVATAIKSLPSVVCIDVAAGKSSDDIIDAGLRAIVGGRMMLSIFPPAGSANRILWFHSLMFSRPPILVISLRERKEKQEFADITSAARALIQKGIRVLVDSSDNSLEPGALVSHRQVIVRLEPMSVEEFAAIPEYKHTMDKLEKEKLLNLVMCVIGSNPASFKLLQESLMGTNPEIFPQVANKFLETELARAKRTLNDFKERNKDNSALMELLSKFENTNAVVEQDGTVLPLLPSPCKVLRKMGNSNNQWTIVPADACMQALLRYPNKDAKGVFQALYQASVVHAKAE